MQLNAVGRSRPFSNPGRQHLVLLLAGIPFEGVRPEVRGLEGVAREFGVDIHEVLVPSLERARAALEARNERRAIQAVERQQELRAILQDEGLGSRRKLALKLGVSPWTIRRDLRELQADPQAGGQIGAYDVLKNIRERLTGNGQSVELPSAAAVASDIAATVAPPHPSRRTVSRLLREIAAHLCDGTPLIPRRSDHELNLIYVVESLKRLIWERKAHG